ncbi:hypothetical protein DNU06_06870 [Putridiphycobacter roseus]|uniref:Secretion system C-terminal sorting domain-containing protein n=1 Tax=Putridiphycobacter roseus TaxID=2219161 RepID=A0A2W1N182_9FLAO|nr:T9SS type A sorting domain-containing protein [Putridiphycobacter roseus]PZE17544.1 hypothetical protein DNU06_06870 [Putridiphycobacter roseus]
MYKTIKLIVFLCFTTFTPLRAQTFEWVKAFNGLLFNDCISLDLSSSGHLITAGTFSGSADFDPGQGTTMLTSVGFTDVYVQKMDTSGNFIWAKSFGGIMGENINQVISDDLGNIYIIGGFKGTVDFNPGSGTVNLTSNGVSDSFILKLDPSGNFLWVNSLSGTSVAVPYDIALDSTGNIYTVGGFSGTIDFDPGSNTMNLTSNGQSDVFVHKMDANGIFQWVKTLGGTNQERALSVITDNSGHLYIAGEFSDTVDFDPGSSLTNLSSNGLSDVFILKLDLDGNFVWAKSFGSVTEDNVYDISVDEFDNVYTLGHFAIAADFDPSAGVYNLTTIGSTALFVQTMDAAGNFIKAITIGGYDNIVGRAITTDHLNNLYITGDFSGDIDFNPGDGTTNLSTIGSTDMFIVKIDFLGFFKWVKTFGGTGQVSGNAISVDTLGNIYTGGCFSGTADFDPNIGVANLSVSGNTFTDNFVHKMSQCMTTIHVTDHQTACNSYTWIDGTEYTSSNVVATHNLISAYGCDSIITLNLTIHTMDISTAMNGLHLQSNNALATSYQWLNCDNDNAVIPNETNQSYTVTSNGSYAVIVNENGCVDTSTCMLVDFVGLNQTNKQTISLHPNPAKGNSTLYFDQIQKESIISIFSTNGQLIQQIILKDDDQQTIDLGEQTSGLYYINVTNKSGNSTQFILINEE